MQLLDSLMFRHIAAPCQSDVMQLHASVMFRNNVSLIFRHNMASWLFDVLTKHIFMPV